MFFHILLTLLKAQCILAYMPLQLWHQLHLQLLNKWYVWWEQWLGILWWKSSFEEVLMLLPYYVKQGVSGQGQDSHRSVWKKCFILGSLGESLLLRKKVCFLPWMRRPRECQLGKQLLESFGESLIWKKCFAPIMWKLFPAPILCKTRYVQAPTEVSAWKAEEVFLSVGKFLCVHHSQR